MGETFVDVSENYNDTFLSSDYVYCSNNTTSATNSSDGQLSSIYRWHEWYLHVHGYLAAGVCIFGIIANLLNIIVLTRKNMKSATNIILTGLAVTDGFTMMAYFPYALQFYVIYGVKENLQRDTKSAAKFTLFYASFSVIVHSISIWFTVTLAIFRYIFIRYPSKGARLCNIGRARLAVILVTICTTILCIPNAATYRLEEQPFDGNGSLWYISPKQETELEKIIYKLNFWSSAILIKLVPCLLLSVLSILLIRAMKQAERRRNKLLQKHHVDGPTDNKRDRKTHRTTRMLLTVVILFLITETPQGIMTLISGIYKPFFDNYYYPLGDTLDILALINNGINFILYCTMSKQFRETFIAIFLKPIFKNDDKTNTSKWTPTRDTDV